MFWVDVRMLKKEYVFVERLFSYTAGSGSGTGDIYSVDVFKLFLLYGFYVRMVKA